MQSYFEQLAATIRPADLFDIAVIAVLLYLSLLWFRLRASRSLIVGLACVIGLFLCARWFDMYLTMMLYQAGFTAVLLALIVVFQQDIRRVFDRVAASPYFGFRQKSMPEASTLSLLAEAVGTLADNRTGALIVLEGREPLDRHVRGGVAVDGRLSLPLLYSIFDHHSSGHDGAVIVTGERVNQFGVHLPLSTNLSEIGHGGTRHAAALGLAELCDACVLAVSEERGTISIAEQGILREVRPAEVSTRLDEFYRTRRKSTRAPVWYREITRNLGLKSAALAIAVVVWLLFAYRVETIHRTFVVPIEYRNLPENWLIDEPRRTRAELTLSGNERAFGMLDASSLAVSFDLSHIADATPHSLPTEKSLKGIPSELKVMQIQPRDVQITIRHKAPEE